MPPALFKDAPSVLSAATNRLSYSLNSLKCTHRRKATPLPRSAKVNGPPSRPGRPYIPAPHPL